MMNDLAAAPRDNDKSLSLSSCCVGHYLPVQVGSGARNGLDQILNRVIEIAGFVVIPHGGMETFCLNKICLLRNDEREFR